MNKILTKKGAERAGNTAGAEKHRAWRKNASPGSSSYCALTRTGERIPLTIADSDPEKGSVTIIFQIVGKTTMLLAEVEEGGTNRRRRRAAGQRLPSVRAYRRSPSSAAGWVAPSHTRRQRRCTKWAHRLDIIARFQGRRNLVILEDEMKAASENLFIMTDDGSYGEHGLVTNKLEERIKGGARGTIP